MSVYLLEVRDADKVLRRGTAWQVSDQLVVTAFHVVGNTEAGGWLHKVYPRASYVLRGNGPSDGLKLEAKDHDCRADIATLVCENKEQLLPGPGLPLHEFEAGPGMRWRAPGFPRLEGENSALSQIGPKMARRS